MFYGYNPMMMPSMNNMDPKFQMNTPGVYFVPVYYDPSRMPKDMNPQTMANMGMYYPMAMYQPNMSEQYNNTKK